MDNYFTNRHGVRVCYRSVSDMLGDIQVYRFELAPMSNTDGAPAWRRSSAFFWSEREAFNTARDIAREAARFDVIQLSFPELIRRHPTKPTAPRDVIRKQVNPLITPRRPAAPIRAYKDD